MNGADFYEEYKEMLNFVGLYWRDKHLAEMSIEKDSLVMTYLGRTASIKLNQEKENGTNSTFSSNDSKRPLGKTASDASFKEVVFTESEVRDINNGACGAL